MCHGGPTCLEVGITKGPWSRGSLTGPSIETVLDYASDQCTRLCAAEFKGDKAIDVRFFDGTVDDAFLLAVRKRRARAPAHDRGTPRVGNRIVGARPEMSDGSIASMVGLAAKTVTVIRRSATGESPQLDSRVGGDRRVRPLNSTEGGASPATCWPSSQTRRSARSRRVREFRLGLLGTSAIGSAVF